MDKCSPLTWKRPEENPLRVLYLQGKSVGINLEIDGLTTTKRVFIRVGDQVVVPGDRRNAAKTLATTKAQAADTAVQKAEEAKIAAANAIDFENKITGGVDDQAVITYAKSAVQAANSSAIAAKDAVEASGGTPTVVQSINFDDIAARNVAEDRAKEAKTLAEKSVQIAVVAAASAQEVKNQADKDATEFPYWEVSESEATAAGTLEKITETQSPVECKIWLEDESVKRFDLSKEPWRSFRIQTADGSFSAPLINKGTNSDFGDLKALITGWFESVWR